MHNAQYEGNLGPPQKDERIDNEQKKRMLLNFYFFLH